VQEVDKKPIIVDIPKIEINPKLVFLFIMSLPLQVIQDKARTADRKNRIAKSTFKVPILKQDVNILFKGTTFEIVPTALSSLRR